MSPEYRFTCERCGERTLIDAGVRELLLEDGCVVCGGPVTDAAFEAVTDGTEP